MQVQKLKVLVEAGAKVRERKEKRGYRLVAASENINSDQIQ